MRRLALSVLIALLALASPACKRKPKTQDQPASEQPALPLVSVVQVNDPAASAQLVRGFHSLEANSWRWTMRKFTVALKPPPGSAQNGARLSLKFTIPEIAFKQMGPTTVTAVINGLALPPETYSKPGDYVYTRDVPASALGGDVVAVDFASDKGFSSPGDARELALIAVSIALAPK